MMSEEEVQTLSKYAVPNSRKYRIMNYTSSEEDDKIFIRDDYFNWFDIEINGEEVSIEMLAGNRGEGPTINTRTDNKKVSPLIKKLIKGGENLDKKYIGSKVDLREIFFHLTRD